MHAGERHPAPMRLAKGLYLLLETEQMTKDSGVTREYGGGRTVPGDTLQGGDTRIKKICGQIYKE